LSDARDSGVSKLLGLILNRILEAQATEQLRDAPYERTQERQGYRNGTYPHTLTTHIGSITLRVPRLRNGKFSTELFRRYQRSEQAFKFAKHIPYHSNGGSSG
jgi:putative transposase